MYATAVSKPLAWTTRSASIVVTDCPDRWRSVTWSGQGFVFTVMADAPSATLDQAVAALPYDAPRGFWGRLSNGFTRLARLANPFG